MWAGETEGWEEREKGSWWLATGVGKRKYRGDARMRCRNATASANSIGKMNDTLTVWVVHGAEARGKARRQENLSFAIS
jgi:hypothetical protein